MDGWMDEWESCQPGGLTAGPLASGRDTGRWSGRPGCVHSPGAWEKKHRGPCEKAQ